MLSCTFISAEMFVAGARNQVSPLPLTQCKDSLKSMYPAADTALIGRGADACAEMWLRDSLPAGEWLPFCIANYLGNDRDKEQLMMRAADHLNEQSKVKKGYLDRTSEVERVYSMGRLTPDVWMKRATGSPVSVEPLLEAVREAVK